MLQALEQLGRRQHIGAQPSTDAAGQGQQFRGFKPAAKPVVSGEHDREDGAGIKLGAGEQPQFGEDPRMHLLRLVGQQDRPDQRSVDMR